jgi:hypothetical protein
MDDQIMVSLPSTTDALSPSTVYLADIKDGLKGDGDTVEFRKIAELPFHATRSRLLSNREGFVTAELRQRYATYMYIDVYIYALVAVSAACR